jgi:hypothetical protein
MRNLYVSMIVQSTGEIYAATVDLNWSPSWTAGWAVSFGLTPDEITERGGLRRARYHCAGLRQGSRNLGSRGLYQSQSHQLFNLIATITPAMKPVRTLNIVLTRQWR